ncbi:hypothetical protein ES703_119546 [subsurface metagenome]
MLLTFPWVIWSLSATSCSLAFGKKVKYLSMVLAVSMGVMSPLLRFSSRAIMNICSSDSSLTSTGMSQFCLGYFFLSQRKDRLR